MTTAVTTGLLAPEWLINSQPLENLARQISADEGLQTTPEPRDVDVVVPGMDGELDLGMDPAGPRRSAGAGQIVFAGWVQGVDPDTGRLGPGESWAAYLRRVDELLRLFAPRRLVIDHLRADGARRAIGKRIGSIQPTRERTSPVLGRWKVAIKIPGAWWSAIDPVTISATVATGGSIPLGGLGVGDAPITDAQVSYGPGSNPTLLQPAAGMFMAYDGLIGAGRELAIDTGAPGCGPGSGSAWAPADSAIRYGPGSRWLDLDPTAGPLTLLHTGGGQMSVAVTARPRFTTS